MLMDEKILNNRYFDELGLAFSRLKCFIDDDKYEKAINRILKFNTRWNDDHEKYLFGRYIFRTKIGDYYNESYNYVLKIRLTLCKIYQYSKESEYHKKDELYFNTIHNDMVLYLELGFTLIFAFRDKLSHFLNIYCNLGIIDKENDFSKTRTALKSKLNEMKAINLDITSIDEIYKIDGRSVEGRAIMNDAKILRKNFIHNICDIQNAAFVNQDEINKHIVLLENAYYLCIDMFDYLNDFINTNGYRIALLYDKNNSQ